MTKERREAILRSLEDLEQRVARTTPGPWGLTEHATEDRFGVMCMNLDAAEEATLPERVGAGFQERPDLQVRRVRLVVPQVDGLTLEDAVFIALAREEVPRLIGLVRMLLQEAP